MRSLLALLLISLNLSAQATSLRLVTGDNYAPFTGKSLPGGGMLTMVVDAALQERGIPYSLDWRPWNRGYLKTLRGFFDATYPYEPGPEREIDYLYSEPLLEAERYLFSRADENIDLNDLSTLRGRSFCHPLGWQAPALLQPLVEQGLLTRHSPIGLNECMRLLLLGRDDFLIVDRRLAEAAMTLVGIQPGQLRRSAEAVSHSTLHLIVPRSHPQGQQLIARFNHGLRSLKESGRYQSLVSDYLQSRDLISTYQTQP